MADRISELPDEVLSHIVSFLPTEDAFATSVLSKRWRPIWLLDLGPNLDLDDQRFLKSGQPYSSFVNMVYMTIHARSVHRPIKKIRLRCESNSSREPSVYDVVAWLGAAADRGLEHLDLQISPNLNFHCCVFSFRNLVVLKLKMVRVNFFVSAADLPLLKTLHLNKVYFYEHCYLIEIVNGCPILEDFEAKNIYIGYLSDDYDGEFKSLTELVRAEISNLSVYEVPLEAFYNAQFLRLEEIYGDVPMFFNLTHVEIVFGINLNWSMVFDVLEKSPKLQNFVLEMPQQLPLFYALCWQPSIFPELSSLFKRCTITNYRGHKHEVLFVQHVMRNSTSLRRMAICSLPSLDPLEKLEMQKEVLSFPKCTETCEIYFE